MKAFHPLQRIIQSLTIWTDRLTYLAQLTREQRGEQSTRRLVEEWITTAEEASKVIADMLYQSIITEPPEPFKPPPRAYRKHPDINQAEGQ